MDLRNKIIPVAYHGTAGKTAEGTDAAFTALIGNLVKLSAWRDLNASKGNSGPFLVGNAATVCDFNLWYGIFDIIQCYRCCILC